MTPEQRRFHLAFIAKAQAEEGRIITHEQPKPYDWNTDPVMKEKRRLALKRWQQGRVNTWITPAPKLPKGTHFPGINAWR